MMQKGSSGGAGAAAGMNFQHRIAAWVAVHILAEKGATPPKEWDLPTGTTLGWLRCETEQPVDDLLVGTSEEGLVFGQIKRNVKLCKGENSDLASVLDQFVRQFVDCRTKTTSSRAWDRALDPARDRLVLITSPRSSRRICTHLPAALCRLRNPLEHRPLSDSALNIDEHCALSV